MRDCGSGFQSRSGFEMKITDRFFQKNRKPITKQKSISDLSEKKFNRECCCVLKMKNGNRFRNDQWVPCNRVRIHFTFTPQNSRFIVRGEERADQ